MGVQIGLLPQVRAGFILQGTTFTAWCRSNGIDPGYAHHVVSGKTNGPSAQALRSRLVEASLGKVA
jgi:hypothetical protein